MDAVLQFIVTNLPMILCLIVGVGLLVLEVFLPGFGLPGLSGVALLTVGVVIAWVNHGEVVGLAASVCHAHDALPRAVYQKYLPQLQELMRRGAAVEGPLPDNQRFNEQPPLPAPKALKSE